MAYPPPAVIKQFGEMRRPFVGAARRQTRREGRQPHDALAGSAPTSVAGCTICGVDVGGTQAERRVRVVDDRVGECRLVGGARRPLLRRRFASTVASKLVAVRRRVRRRRALLSTSVAVHVPVAPAHAAASTAARRSSTFAASVASTPTISRSNVCLRARLSEIVASASGTATAASARRSAASAASSVAFAAVAFGGVHRIVAVAEGFRCGGRRRRRGRRRRGRRW